MVSYKSKRKEMKLNKMFLEERLKFIESKLNKDYRVNVSDLADDLKVSEVTIRKDLKELEEKNIAKRTHGGAIKIQKNIKELAVDNKKTINIDLKKSIALKASKFLEDDIVIFLDSGTTTYMLVDYIKKYKNIEVITYDLGIAYSLSDFENIKTYLLGGYVDRKTRTLSSIDGLENLSRLHADICFMGTDAYDEKFVYSTSEKKGRIKRKMIENSNLSIMMTDTSKFGKTGFYSFNECDEFDYFITEDFKSNI